MADYDDVPLSIMNDEGELVQSLMIGDQAVRAVERVVMRFAGHLQRGLQGLAAERGGIRVLGADGQRSPALDFQLST